MTTTTLKEVLAISNEATKVERERCLKAVADEEELPGRMPDEMWAMVQGDRDAVEELMRCVVRETKAAIRERILN